MLFKKDCGSQNGDGGIMVFKDGIHLFTKNMFDNKTFDDIMWDIKTWSKYNISLLTEEDIKQIKGWVGD